MQTFTTVGGTVLTIKPVTAFFILQVAMKVEREWREKGEPIDPPTYTLKLAAGDEETFPHQVTDEINTLEVEGDPEQTKVNKLRWAKHLAAFEKFQEAQDTAVRDALIRECVEYEVEEKGGWQEKWERLGIPIPKDQRFFYLKHELLTAADYMTLTSELRLLADGKEVTQEMQDALGRLFRSAVGPTEWKGIKQLFDRARAMVGASETGPVADGEGLGIDAEPVG